MGANASSPDSEPSQKDRSLPIKEKHKTTKLKIGKKVDGDAAAADDDDVDDESPEEVIARLENDIRVLNDRCSSLEAQTILVAVQQLDMIAQTIAWILSLLTMYFWFRIIWFVGDFLPELIVSNKQYLLDVLFHTTKNENMIEATIQFLTWVNHPIPLTLLKLLLSSIPYFYNELNHGSAHRRFEVFAIAFIIYMRVRLCRWREKMFMSKDRSDIPNLGENMSNDAIWEINYEVSARFLYVSIFRLKGLWTKTAQYLASRSDFMPISYVRELTKLQDQAPGTEWNLVKPLLSKKLLRELMDVEETPMASASIGQVHQAKLKSTGEKVVIKVQHPHAKTLILDDFWSLKVIMSILTWFEPDYKFLEILIREWSVEARKELDFTNEANNLILAKSSIDSLLPTKDSVINATNNEGTLYPFQVEIPKPIRHLSSDRVLVMSFCEGVRMDDMDKVEEWNLSRGAIVDAISQTFAHMMYCSPIFNGDPHCGNMLIRPGTSCTNDTDKGFTIVLLDWGLAKRLPNDKRLAFCQMIHAAATLDYGLLLDSYKKIGLKLKAHLEDSGRRMEELRFFLRDMAPRELAKKRIKQKHAHDMKRFKELKKEDRVPMESKAYPGEFFFFVRVNELLHGLGSKYSVNLKYLDAIQPYAERGLRQSDLYKLSISPLTTKIKSKDTELAQKLINVFNELESSNQLVGAQVCVLDTNGEHLANETFGSLGGLYSHIPMQQDALVLGYSCTKAIAATIAHIMVKDGYLSYDEPLCERVWKQFCPTKEPPFHLEDFLGITIDELKQRWAWKRQITLRHVLTHKAGMWLALPAKLTIKNMASCESCLMAFEYNSDYPEDTLLPESEPNGKAEYHVLSFGWLVAGAVCGAFAERHGRDRVTYDEVYKKLLVPRLSPQTLELGFEPCGSTGKHLLAQTVTSNLRASMAMQMRRESKAFGEETKSPELKQLVSTLKQFYGKEFLLDPRVWNCSDVISANVPAAGGRFSASGLASFYHDLATSGKILDDETIKEVSSIHAIEKNGSALQGATNIANDAKDSSGETALGFGYQLFRFDTLNGSYPGFGHAGVGGSIGFHHKPGGLSIGLMLNKADGGKEITMKILRVISGHLKL